MISHYLKNVSFELLIVRTIWCWTIPDLIIHHNWYDTTHLIVVNHHLISLEKIKPNCLKHQCKSSYNSLGWNFMRKIWSSLFKNTTSYRTIYTFYFFSFRFYLYSIFWIPVLLLSIWTCDLTLAFLDELLPGVHYFRCIIIGELPTNY